MKPLAKLYMERADNELAQAELLFQISNSPELQQKLNLPQRYTFYSGTISHAYYAIFNAAKAMLAEENVSTSTPNVHRKTYDAFEKYFVTSGKLDFKLLTIYKQLLIRAEELLVIFKSEKGKRGRFTYHQLPQANKEPAEQSLKNANTFYKHINATLEST